MGTRDFMRAGIEAATFAITRLQSDHGIEFTNKFMTRIGEPKIHVLDLLRALLAIHQVLMPVSEKELQGLVKRLCRQDGKEVFHRIRPLTLVEFNRKLA